MTENSISSFISHVKAVAQQNNVKLHLPKNKFIDDGDGRLCNGYFNDDPKPVLAVALGKPQEEWLPILVHEFGHMNQWIESHPYWTGLRGAKGEASDLLDQWLEGTEFTQKIISSFTKALINVEYDCECRTLKEIKKFNLPIDKEIYIQKSLSYVLFYHVVRKTRKWYTPGLEPYMIPEVFSAMPKTMDINIHNPDPQLIEIIEKYCIK